MRPQWRRVRHVVKPYMATGEGSRAGSGHLIALSPCRSAPAAAHTRRVAPEQSHEFHGAFQGADPCKANVVNIIQGWAGLFVHTSTFQGDLNSLRVFAMDGGYGSCRKCEIGYG